MKSRLARIRQLAHRNRGRQLLPGVMEGLSRALGEPVETHFFTSVEETERLEEAFSTGLQSCSKSDALCFRETFVRGSAKQVFAMANCLAMKIQDDRAWLLLTKIACYCGAVSLAPSLLLARAESVIAFDMDSLCILSVDEQEGLFLDYMADDPEETYILAVWGERWPLLTLDCAGPGAIRPTL